MTEVLTGIVCDNTCSGWFPWDDSPDAAGLFGPVFGNLMGDPFTLVIDPTTYSLTINGHTLTFPQNDPQLILSFNDPTATFNFGPNTILFQANVPNIFGFTTPTQEFLCEVPGVPEPTTAALFLAGAVLLAVMLRKNK